MVAQPSHNHRNAPLIAQVQKIKNGVDELIRKMQKETGYSPTHAQLDEYAEQLLNFMNKNHLAITGSERYLKAAVIDLTEIPEMAPQMQRLSILTALKDASHNLLSFIEG